MSNYTNISEPERCGSRLLRGDNPASSPRSLLKRVPLTCHFAKRMKCCKSTGPGVSCSKSTRAGQERGGFVSPPEGPPRAPREQRDSSRTPAE